MESPLRRTSSQTLQARNELGHVQDHCAPSRWEWLVLTAPKEQVLSSATRLIAIVQGEAPAFLNEDDEKKTSERETRFAFLDCSEFV